MKVILGKSVKFRDGIESDATSLALFFDAAGRRIPAFFWSLYANEGQSFFEFGRENIRTNDEEKSYYKNWQIAELDNEQEKLEFLKELNLDQTTLSKVIKSGYKLLGLINYFTCGPKESRSWTITKNCTAPKAAGEIHTDFEKGFIRAETVSYEDFVKNGGWLKSKELGKMRLEGKDYIIKDGDVLNFRFNT